MLSAEALQPYYESSKNAAIAVFEFIKGSARASAAKPHIQQMEEFTGAREILKSLIIKTSQLEDHQLIILCIIVGLLSLAFLLKLSQSLPYRPSEQTPEGPEEQDESSDKSATRGGFASIEINPQ